MKKNKFLIALLIIALFIPTYIGIANYIYMRSTPVEIDQAQTIQIKDSVSGMVYDEKSGSEIMTLIKEMESTATPISSLPSGLVGQSNFSVTAFDGTRETSSQYYIVKDKALGYYVDSKGGAFEIDEAAVAKFLDTKYAQGLYEEALLPTLTNGANVIAPTSYTWAYTPASGSGSVDATVTKTAEETVTYTSKSGLSLKFSREPDSFEVAVKTEDGKEIAPKTPYASLTGVDTKANPKVVVEATATWNQSESLPFGSASYTFILDIEAQPEFFIAVNGEADDFLPGDIALLTALSVKEPEKISVTISPELLHDGKEIKPVFYTDGKDSYALLPTSYDTAPGVYTVSLSYEGVNEELSMTLYEKEFKIAGTHPASKTKISTTYTEATLADYDKKVEDLLASTDSSVKYFTSDAFLPANTGYSNGTSGGLFGYGRTKSLADKSGLYRNEGLDYSMSAGHKVRAVTDGKVIYVGFTEFSGDIIVIDHGYGMMSWYHNLDKNSIKVKENDTVKRGDVICEKVGDSGFTNGSTLHQRLTVNGVPVCEYDLWNAGITFKTSDEAPTSAE